MVGEKIIKACMFEAKQIVQNKSHQDFCVPIFGGKGGKLTEFFSHAASYNNGDISAFIVKCTHRTSAIEMPRVQ